MSLLCLAKIIRHEAVAPGHYRLTFAAPEMAQVAEPGQFVHVRCGDTLDPLLRRPLSLHGIDRVAGTLTLLYRVVGRGTELLSRLPAGATLDVMGPLGRGFYLPEPLQIADNDRPPVTEALVVGGGLGVAPLLPLVETLVKRGLPVTVILGARSADGLLAVEAFSQTGAQVEIATDDGSRGTRGNAVDLLKQQLEQKGITAKPSSGAGGVDAALHIPGPKGITDELPGGAGSVHNETSSLIEKGVLAEAPAGICVYSCGPVPMLRAVWQLCAAYRVPLQVSLEERMGCGVGACLACVCQVKTAVKPDEAVAKAAGKVAEPGAPAWKYARVCVEGPVFWGEEVILDAE